MDKEPFDIEVNEKESLLYIAGKNGVMLIDDNDSYPLSIDPVKQYCVEANFSKIAVDEEAESVYLINQDPLNYLFLITI